MMATNGHPPQVTQQDRNRAVELAMTAKTHGRSLAERGLSEEDARVVVEWLSREYTGEAMEGFKQWHRDHA